MARKVLISFLGTGPLESKENRVYKTVDYRLDNHELKQYPFVSAALKKHYQIDTVILVGTPRSMWEEVYRWFCVENNAHINENTYYEIAESCESANYLTPLEFPHRDAVEQVIGNDSKVVLIRYGLNESEIKENIDIILGLQQYLNNNDELIVDVTHSFRSLPMFMMNLLIYLKNVSQKNITISHIHYGMLEMSKELGYAPIVDLKTMMNVNDWITGAYSFYEYGNAYKISELIRNQDKSVAILLDEFSNLMNLNHLDAIHKISQRLSAVKNKDYQTLLPALTINPIVKSFISRFSVATDSQAMFQLKVARWQLDHRKYAQAMLTASECMITFVCETNKQKWDDFDIREGAKAALLNHHPETDIFKPDNRIKQIYRNLKPLRNCTAHSLETASNVTLMLKILNDSITQLESIIVQATTKGGASHNAQKGQHILVNFSNHPYKDWSKNQKDASAKYNKVVDIAFPVIAPDASESDLQQMVDSYVQQIQSLAGTNRVTVHIMGEMTFAFMVIIQLKSLGIECIASTSARNVEDMPDGKKLSDFQFVKFRRY